MLVISYGIPKSGSTLAFELLRGALESAGHPQFLLRNERPEEAKAVAAPRRNFVNEISRENVQEMIAKIGPGRILAVKTHSPFKPELFCWLEEMQAAGEIQIIANYRDPRDICLSLMDASRRAEERGQQPFSGINDLETAAQRVQKRVVNFRRWAAVRGSLRIRYDDVAFDTQKVLDGYERVLGITFDRAQVLRYAFEEADTLRNKAKRNRWRDELDDAQKEFTRKCFRKFIFNAINHDNQEYHEQLREQLIRRCRKVVQGSGGESGDDDGEAE
jgi:hypothetical protein